MRILERKWKLMQRDPLCIEFDEVLCASLKNSKDEGLRNKKNKLEKNVEDKWKVNIYRLEPQFKLAQMFEQNPENPILCNLNGSLDFFSGELNRMDRIDQ